MVELDDENLCLGQEILDHRAFYLLGCLFFITPKMSWSASDCLQPNNQFTRVIGCVLGEPNELFVGEVHRVKKGKFEVRSNLGSKCLGTFRRTFIGTAKVATTCDDG